MKKYTFAFWPNGQLATISVITKTRREAIDLVRAMISDWFLDDGLVMQDEEPYEG